MGSCIAVHHGGIHENFRIMVASKAKAVFFMPWLAQIAPDLSGWRQYEREIPFTYNFLRNYCQTRLKSHQDGAEVSDFSDIYMNEIKRVTKNGDKESSFYGKRGGKLH